MKSLIIKLVSALISKLIQLSPPRAVHASSLSIFKKLENYSDTFFTYHLRPKKASHYQLNSADKEHCHSAALIIQGPLIEEDDFTLETIRVYKKNFVNTHLIVSTWEDQNLQLISKIKEEGAIVILSKIPENPGPLNINYQITSSKSGILKAKEIGVEFVYKTRTDQRIYGTNLTTAFIELLNNYPISNSFGMKYRLLSPNFTTLKYRPYGLSDMVMFGHIDDMLLYWDARLDQRERGLKFDSKITIKEYAQLRLAETYLCTTFLEKINYRYDFSLANSWSVYRDLFIIVDHSVFDLFWNKYERQVENRFEYYFPHSYQLMKFTDWLVLQSKVDIQEYVDENILLTIEGHIISKLEK